MSDIPQDNQPTAEKNDQPFVITPVVSMKKARVKKAVRVAVESVQAGAQVVAGYGKAGLKRGRFMIQKYPRVAWIVLAAVVLILLSAMSGSKTSVGIVDIIQVREKGTIYQNILATQQNLEEEWRLRFNAEKEVLAKEDKALADQRSKMKKAAFKKKVDALQKKVVALQQKYQAEYAQIMMASNVAIQQADQKVLELMQWVGEKQGVAVILPKAAALYTADAADLTAVFIDRFNREEFSVSYPDPKTMVLPAQQ